MKNGRSRIKIITFLSLIIALISLGIGYMAYSMNNEVSGTSTIVESVYDIKMDNINSASTSKEDIVYKTKPFVVGNEVTFGIGNFSHEGNVSFKFDIYNNGNVDAIIKSIELIGIDNYSKNIEYSLSNIKVGDVIKGESKIVDNTFKLNYKNPIYDKRNNLISVDLDEVVLKINFELIKQGE